MREQIFDPVRKKRVALTPEESVRQQLIRFLNEKAGVPFHLMNCEYSFEINRLKYRADVVIFGRDAKPIVIIECKAPEVKISKSVFEQIFRYNEKLQVPYLLLSNGTSTYFGSYNHSKDEYEYLSEIPHYNELSK